MYEAKEAAFAEQAIMAKSEASNVPAWAFPMFGVLAMFSFAALVTVRSRRTRSTRQFQLVEPVQNEESFLTEEDSSVE